MDAKTRFAALETMCRERALLAEKDLRYWLEEAEEWARFKAAQEPTIDSPPLQLEIGIQSDVSIPYAARQSRWESRDNQDENAPLLG